MLAVADRGGFPYLLLYVWDLDRLATVADYQQLARVAIADIQSRGRVPILVGGSGLYINAAVDAMVFPGVDPVIRAKWEAELERIGPEELHAVLALRDPAAAALMEPKNGRRTVRALEVIEITGKPYNAGLGVPASFLPTIRLGLRRPREQLDAIVAERVQHKCANSWRKVWLRRRRLHARSDTRRSPRCLLATPPRSRRSSRPQSRLGALFAVNTHGSIVTSASVGLTQTCQLRTRAKC